MKKILLALVGGAMIGLFAASHAKLPAPPPKSDTEKAADATKAAAAKAKEGELNAKARGLQPQGERGRVLGRCIPLARLVHRRKLQHHEALWLPAAFLALHYAAAHQVFAAVLGDGGGNELAVLLVDRGIGDLDFGDDVAGHGAPPQLTSTL